MALGKVELRQLVIKAFSYKELTEKETKRMLKALWKKYWDQRRLDSFQEKIVLASYIHFPDSKEARDKNIRDSLDSLTSKPASASR